MSYRDVHEHHISAMRRASLAVDRSIRASTPAEKEKARR